MRLFLLIFTLLVLILAGCGVDAGVNVPQPSAAGTSTQIAMTNPEATPVARSHLPAAQPTACPDAPGPITGTIVFSANGNLMALGPDGDKLQQLTRLAHGVLAHDPAWSVDGQTLAFTLTQPVSDPNNATFQVGAICGLDSATGKGRVLARGAQATVSLGEAAWVPDGQSLLVNMQESQFDANNNYVSNKLSIGRYELATGQFQALVENATSPAPSPDNQRLAYLALDPQSYEATLTVARADGRDPQLVTATQQFSGITTPRWSPDGAQIAIAAAGGNHPHTGGAAPAPERLLLETLLGISIAQAHGDPAHIWVVNATNFTLRQSQSEELDDPRIAWGPDGRLVYTDNGPTDGPGSVRLLDPRTGAQEQIAEQMNFLGIAWASR